MTIIVPALQVAGLCKRFVLQVTQSVNLTHRTRRAHRP